MMKKRASREATFEALSDLDKIYEMQKILDINKSLDVPGPGAYNSSIEAVKPVYVTHSFNKARKKSFDLKTRNEEKVMPGPGNYEPNPDFIKPRATEISMTMAGASKISLRSKRNKSPVYFDKELPETPGPGSY